MKFLRNSAIALAFLGVMLVPSANAQAATIEEMLKQIETLMTQIQELQKQLATIKGEVQDIIKDGLAEGMTDEDIAKLQQLLATDPSIYPEGKVTGYFGPLTKQAVMRFQMRNGLPVTGVVSEETHDLLVEYLSEGFGDNIPPGLLRAPGIAKKVEMRYALGCDKNLGGGRGMGPLCKKLKIEYGDDDDDDSNDDDDDSSDDGFHVEVEIEDGETTVEFKFEGKTYTVVEDTTDADDIIDAVAAKLVAAGKIDDEEDLDEDLEDEIRKEIEDALEDVVEDFDVEVEIENGSTTVSFEFEGDDYEVEVDSTDEDDVLDAVAEYLVDEETIEDEEDLDEDLADAIADALEAALDDEDEVSEEEADEAMDDADDAIEDAQTAVNAAPAGEAKDDAQDLIDSANLKLADAEDEFDDEDYEDAKELADEAKGLAEDAMDLVD